MRRCSTAGQDAPYTPGRDLQSVISFEVPHDALSSQVVRPPQVEDRVLELRGVLSLWFYGQGLRLTNPPPRAAHPCNLGKLGRSGPEQSRALAEKAVQVAERVGDPLALFEARRAQLYSGPHIRRQGL